MLCSHAYRATTLFRGSIVPSSGDHGLRRLAKGVIRPGLFETISSRITSLSAATRLRCGQNTIAKRGFSGVVRSKSNESVREENDLGKESSEVAKMLAAHQYAKVVQYWDQKYAESANFVNFYVGVCAIRASREIGNFEKEIEIARKLLNVMLQYSGTTSRHVKHHSGTIVIALMRQKRDEGLKEVTQMIDALAARQLSITTPTYVVIKTLLMRGNHTANKQAIALLKEKSKKYVELKKSSFHLVDLLTVCFKRNLRETIMSLLALMNEWNVEFSASSLLLLVEAALKGEFPSDHLQANYLPLFDHVPAADLNAHMILAVARFVRQHNLTDLYELPIRMYERKMAAQAEISAHRSNSISDADQDDKEAKKVEPSPSWLDYQMSYHLIAIAIELRKIDMAVRFYAASLECRDANKQSYSTLNAFFLTGKPHPGLHFAGYHILGDINYIFEDGTSHFFPQWDPHAAYNFINAPYLLSKLLFFQKWKASLLLLPLIYEHIHEMDWTVAQLKNVITPCTAGDKLGAADASQLWTRLDELSPESDVPIELIATVFIHAEKMLMKKARRNVSPSRNTVRTFSIAPLPDEPKHQL